MEWVPLKAEFSSSQLRSALGQGRVGEDEATLAVGPDCLLKVYHRTPCLGFMLWVLAAGPDSLLIVYQCSQGLGFRFELPAQKCVGTGAGRGGRGDTGGGA
jgi:hypothetical protein